MTLDYKAGPWILRRRYPDPHPGAWEFVHEQYDGPEDGRCGNGRDLEEVLAEITLLEELAEAVEAVR